MNNHLQALPAGRQYSEEFKEEATMRVVFGGEDPREVIRILDIHNIYVLNNWVTAYKKQIETGLVTLPPMTEKQRLDVQELRQRNKELEHSLKEANLMILALNTIIEVAERELKIPIRKKHGTRRP